MENLHEAEDDALKKVEIWTKRIGFVSRFIMLKEEDYIDDEGEDFREKLIDNYEVDFDTLTLHF